MQILRKFKLKSQKCSWINEKKKLLLENQNEKKLENEIKIQRTCEITAHYCLFWRWYSMISIKIFFLLILTRIVRQKWNVGYDTRTCIYRFQILFFINSFYLAFLFKKILSTINLQFNGLMALCCWYIVCAVEMPHY